MNCTYCHVSIRVWESHTDFTVHSPDVSSKGLTKCNFIFSFHTTLNGKIDTFDSSAVICSVLQLSDQYVIDFKYSTIIAFRELAGSLID